MKKIFISLTILLFCSLSFGQTTNDRQVPFHVTDSTTNFNSSLIEGTLVVDEDADKIWILNERAFGSDNLSTVTKTLIAVSGGGGGADLATTLGLGNTSGANDISMNTGTLLKSTTGSSKIALQPTSLTLQSGAFGVDVTAFTGLSNLSNVLSLANTTFTKVGQVGIFNNDDGDIFSGATDQYPVLFSAKNAKIKQNVVNSNIMAGLNITGKSNNTAYASNFGFNRNEGFETILTHTTATQDNLITWQDASGVPSFTSQLLENSDITLAADRTITYGGNDLTFTGGESIFERTALGGKVLLGHIDGLTSTAAIGLFGDLSIPNFAISKGNGNNDLYINRPLNSDVIRFRYGGGTDQMILNATDFRTNTKLVVGSTSKTALSQLESRGLHNGTNTWAASFHDITTHAAGTGGGIYLTGNTDGTGDESGLAAIRGEKSTGTAGEHEGDLAFYAGTNGNDEFMRIDNTGGIGMGTPSPDANAILDLTSTTKTFLPPRMTTGQRDAILSEPTGGMIYNITISKMQVWDGGSWADMN